jgi:hypothetical protein
MSAQWITAMSPWGPDRGSGAPPSEKGIRAMHMIHLRTGEILVIDRHNFMYRFEESLTVWHQVQAPDAPGLPGGKAILSCAGHCQLPDGRILLAGGNWIGGGTNRPAPKHVYILDPEDDLEPWEYVGEMVFARFYPTCTTLWDGRVLISGGWKQEFNEPNNPRVVEQMELYDPSTGELELLDPVQNQEFYPFMFFLPDETILWAGPAWADPLKSRGR